MTTLAPTSASHSREPLRISRLHSPQEARIMDITADRNHAVVRSRADIHDPSYQAFQLLHWGFVAAPFLAGLDKFFNLLTHWEGYLSPAFARLSPLSPHATMQAVGVVEMIAAVVVAIRPRFGAYVVAAWLV